MSGRPTSIIFICICIGRQYGVVALVDGSGNTPFIHSLKSSMSHLQELVRL
jgi:hypothetical protein